MCVGRKFSGTANSAWQVWRNGRYLRTKQSVATLQIQHGENGAVFGRGTSLSLSLSLSLVARTFWHTFGLNLKGFFTHFVVVSSRFIVDFTHFIAILSRLIVNFSYFIVVLSRLFTHKRHFLGHCAFLKFLNALFVRFCALFVILSLLQKGEKSTKIKENLPFLDTSLALSMTNSGFCLKTTDKENALCHLKMTADFVILSVAKNPHKLKENLPFLDTSLRSV